jgi:NAD+ kinase
MEEGMEAVLYEGGDAIARSRTRIHCVVKSTFSETRLVPALNDILISNPSPAAVSRFRMGWLEKTTVASSSTQNGQTLPSNDATTSNTSLQSTPYGTVTRFGGIPYHVAQSINVWSSGMWICTATGSTAAMAAAGGSIMADLTTPDLQYLIREHMMENATKEDTLIPNNGFITTEQQKLHIRWNSHKGRIFIDGSHLTHNLELGDEILIDNQAPPLQLFERKL